MRPVSLLGGRVLLYRGDCRRIMPTLGKVDAIGQKRVHPAQKPVALMEWCLDQMRLPAGTRILDPYMGAGATGIAAIRRGHGFIGIEIEPLYFDAARSRIAAEIAALDGERT
jgi:site-specific DNA-methyltransferase (adenine-specific)/modification methylase